MESWHKLHSKKRVINYRHVVGETNRNDNVEQRNLCNHKLDKKQSKKRIAKGILFQDL